MNHSDINHGFACFNICFVIGAQPSVFVEPTKCPFNNPTLWQNFESFEIICSFHNFKLASVITFNPFDELAGIATIGPDKTKMRKEMFDLFENQLGSVPILNIGCMNNDSK